MFAPFYSEDVYLSCFQKKEIYLLFHKLRSWEFIFLNISFSHLVFNFLNHIFISGHNFISFESIFIIFKTRGNFWELMLQIYQILCIFFLPIVYFLRNLKAKKILDKWNYFKKFNPNFYLNFSDKLWYIKWFPVYSLFYYRDFVKYANYKIPHEYFFL